VEWVVAPVVAVLELGALDDGLLLFAVRRGGRDARRDAALFRHAADIVDGQQVDIGHAGLAQSGEVLHAVRSGFGEGRYLPRCAALTVLSLIEKSRTCSS
jgi:hypothetical protein